MEKKKTKIFNILILIFITILVLYFSLKDDYKLIIKQILSINPIFLILSILFVILYWVFSSIVMNLFLGKITKYSFKKTFRLQIMTQFFNAITPFSSGGQPFEVYYLKKDGIKISDSTNVLIEHFIVYQLALILLGTVAIMANRIFGIFPPTSILKKLVTLGYIINVIVVLVLFYVSFNKKGNKFVVNVVISFLNKLKIVKDKQETKDRWNNYINDFNKGAKTLFKDKKLFLGAIFLNILGLSCLYLVPILILFGLGDFTSMNGILTIITSSYVMLIGSFVPIPGGTGGLEYGFIAFYGNFITGSKLKAVMLLWRFITYYFGMIVGSVLISLKERK